MNQKCNYRNKTIEGHSLKVSESNQISESNQDKKQELIPIPKKIKLKKN